MTQRPVRNAYGALLRSPYDVCYAYIMTTTKGTASRDHITDEAAHAAHDVLTARGVTGHMIRPDPHTYGMMWEIVAPASAFDCDACGGDGGWDLNDNGTPVACTTCDGTGVSLDALD